MLFGPLYLLTGRPLVATAIVTFLTYPLAALAMAALLVRLGCARLVAWVCGLVFAVGILRIPLNFHVLQYPNLFLPLAALGAVRARSAPGWKSALWLFAVLLATLLTSYYIAGIVCIALAIWVFADLLTLRPRAVAFVTTVVLSLLAAVGVTAILLHPYIVRSRGMVPNALPWDHGGQLRLWVQMARDHWDKNADYWRVPFAFLVLLGLGGRGDATWRRIALPGALLCFLGTAIVIVGLPDGLGQLAAHTPLRNFRGWGRLLMVTDFGLCLLAAAGLDVCRRRFGKRVALVPIAAFALLAALPRLTALVSAMSPVPLALGARADAYRTVKLHRRARARPAPGAADRNHDRLRGHAREARFTGYRCSTASPDMSPPMCRPCERRATLCRIRRRCRTSWTSATCVGFCSVRIGTGRTHGWPRGSGMGCASRRSSAGRTRSMGSRCSR